MQDGVYPHTFNGEPTFRIIFCGRELPMYWRNENEAQCHFWLLQMPIFKARHILQHAEDGRKDIYATWRSEWNQYGNRRYERRKAVREKYQLGSNSAGRPDCASVRG